MCRSGRLPGVQICTVRPGERGDPVPVSACSGEPRHDEGSKDGARATMERACTQTDQWRTVLQTRSVKDTHSCCALLRTQTVPLSLPF